MIHSSADLYLCQSQNVQAYFDNELDSAMRLLVERHIGDCAVCTAELSALEQVQTLIGLAFRNFGGLKPVPQWH